MSITAPFRPLVQAQTYRALVFIAVGIPIAAVVLALAVAELSLIAAAFGWITMPIWYRWTDNNYGSWHVDTLGRAFLFVPAGIVALVGAGWLAQALGAMWAWQVRSLLAARPAPASP